MSFSPTSPSGRWSAAPTPRGTASCKRGSRGAIVLRRRRDSRRSPAEVVDTTGAGDALAAGFLVGGIELGLEAAAPLRRRARGGAVTERSESPRKCDERFTSGGPVVALETTLWHTGSLRAGVEVGRPRGRGPRRGAVPATVGVLDGQVVVGLDADGARALRAPSGARKAGPRDLAACVAQGELGATTVGGTLAVCAPPESGSWAQAGSAASIAALPSGRTSRPTWRARATPALVVSSGVKSLLDVPATAELLETLGVPGARLPHGRAAALLRGGGGPPVSARVEAPGEAAASREAHWELGGAGLLLARPPDDGIATSSR